MYIRTSAPTKTWRSHAWRRCPRGTSYLLQCCHLASLAASTHERRRHCAHCRLDAGPQYDEQVDRDPFFFSCFTKPLHCLPMKEWIWRMKKWVWRGRKHLRKVSANLITFNPPQKAQTLASLYSWQSFEHCGIKMRSHSVEFLYSTSVLSIYIAHFTWNFYLNRLQCRVCKIVLSVQIT